MIVNLEDIYKNKQDEFVNDLLNQHLTVFEKISGSTFYLKRIGDDFFYYKKFYNPITQIDRVLSNFYEKAISYLETIKQSILNEIPENVYFCFEYIPDTSVNIVQYEKIPKNNLVLISINNEEKIKHTDLNKTSTFDKFADIFQCDVNFPIFQGFLNDEQKSKILDYFTNELNKTPFSEYIIKILNSDLQNTKFSDSFGQIESFVFIFGDDKKTYAKLVDPVFQTNFHKSLEDNKNRDDLIKIIFSDLISFLNRTKKVWKQIKLSGKSFDERYIDFISKNFLEFYNESKDRYLNCAIVTPEVFKNNIFNLNHDFIKDQNVLDIINKSKDFEQIFKLFVLLFRKKKKNKQEFIFPNLLKIQNNLVDEIYNFIEGDISEYSNLKEFLETFLDEDGKHNQIINEQMYDIEEDNEKFAKRLTQMQVFLTRIKNKFKTEDGLILFITNKKILTDSAIQKLEKISNENSKKIFLLFLENDKRLESFRRDIWTNNNFFEGFQIHSNLSFLEILNYVFSRNNFSDFYIDSDIFDLFLLQNKYIKNIYDVEFKLNRFKDNDYNGFLESLENNNIQKFKELTPIYLHSLFFNKDYFTKK